MAAIEAKRKEVHRKTPKNRYLKFPTEINQAFKKT